MGLTLFALHASSTIALAGLHFTVGRAVFYPLGPGGLSPITPMDSKLLQSNKCALVVVTVDSVVYPV